jgi:DNA-binding NarL/FixJ family response regulator
MPSTRLIVIEDNRLMREGLTAMLEVQTGLRVVASLSNGESLLRGKNVDGDIVLLDLGLRSPNSLHLIESLRATRPKIKIIVMDLAPSQSTLVEYVTAGVSGFVLKDATFADFLNTIRAVAHGEKVMPPPLTASLFSQIAFHAASKKKGNLFRSVKMTGREREVVELIAEGLSNKEIAGRLNLAVDTIKSHVHNILEKLALHTRLEIASYRHARDRFSTLEAAEDDGEQ